MRDLRFTRRRLLFAAGSGVLGVTVLNTVTGCSASPDRPGTGNATPGAAGTTGAPGTVAGDEVFGLRIIGTPGHTAGHISVFDPSTGVLVAGDALRTTDGLVGSDPQYTADESQAADSVRKLAALDVKAILPGHAEPLTAGAADALRKLAASLPAS